MRNEKNDQSNHPAAAYVSARELGQMFSPRLSLGFIRKLQKGRTIPFIRLGRRVVFDPVAVRKTLAETLTVYPKGQQPKADAA